MRWVIDAGAHRCLATAISGEPPTATRTTRFADAELPAAPTQLIHRLIHAPAGVPEVTAEVDVQALRAAGALEPADTESRAIAWQLARRRWPDVPQVAVFDDVWFNDLPAAAATYALPPALVAEHGLRRRGRHGPVHRLAAAECGAARVVSVVLGGGSSVAAVRDGRPVEVSCGATALEGVPGEVTSGDLDPAAVLYLVEPLGCSLDEVEAALSVTGGLTGVREGHEGDTVLARQLLAHRLKRFVGAYAAVMGGVDAVVLSSNRGAVPAELIDDLIAGLPHLGLGDTVPVTTSAWNSCTAAAVLVG